MLPFSVYPQIEVWGISVIVKAALRKNIKAEAHGVFSLREGPRRVRLDVHRSVFLTSLAITINLDPRACPTLQSWRQITQLRLQPPHESLPVLVQALFRVSFSQSPGNGDVVQQFFAARS